EGAKALVKLNQDSPNRASEMSRPNKASLFLFLLLLPTNPSPIFGQAAKAELIGNVRDQNRALIPQATITLTDTTNQQTISAPAGDGLYIITNLKPGVYDVTASANGFKQTLRKGVRLATGERVRLDLVLEPGAVTESVT